VDCIANENLSPKRLKDLRKFSGINGPSEFQHLPSISLVRSFPPDPMHTIFINFARDTYAHWKGTWDFIDHTKPDDYILSDDDWKDIGQELYNARKSTPAHWGRPPRNINDTSSSWKAEEWKNWILRWSIPLLYGRLPDKYLRSWHGFVEALQIAISHNIEYDLFKKMSDGVYQWAQDYERYEIRFVLD
jgi:hypothetical protein